MTDHDLIPCIPWVLLGVILCIESGVTLEHCWVCVPPKFTPFNLPPQRKPPNPKILSCETVINQHNFPVSQIWQQQIFLSELYPEESSNSFILSAYRNIYNIMIWGSGIAYIVPKFVLRVFFLDLFHFVWVVVEGESDQNVQHILLNV